MTLHCRDLYVVKDGKTICHVPELDVARGERVALLGPNGSGKTTLLRVLSGLESDIRGACHIEPPLRQRVYVHQAPYVFCGSVYSNVGFGLVSRRLSANERASRVRHWLDVFGISSLSERHRQKLSGGERRRVALARAFAVEAELMLLDEPFADLDENGIQLVSRAIAEASNSTILIASPVPIPISLGARIFRLQTPER